MTQTRDAIRQAIASLSDVAWAQTGGVVDSELVDVARDLEQLGRLVDAGRAFAAGEIAERSRYELGAEGLSQRYGERKPVEFLERLLRVSKAEVSRRIRVGMAVRERQSLLGEELAPERPFVASAFAAGSIGIDAAAAILFGLKQASTGCDATPENMGAAEQSLVQSALTEPADSVSAQTRLWREAMDPDGIEPRHEDIRARQTATMGRERNGITPIHINAGPFLAAEFRAAWTDPMDPKVGPRFLSDEDRARAETVFVDVDGVLVPRLIDPRALAEKQHDITEGILLEALRATREGPVDMRTVGTVTATIQLSDLKAGTGFGILEGTDEVIPGSVVQELACENGYFEVLLGEKGEPLSHGLLKRYATAAQRRSIIARDGDRCLMCGTTASKSHVHHVIWYSEGGGTDVINMVILCPTHHHGVHQGHFEIRMIDGLPWIRMREDSWDDTAWKPAGKNRLLVPALAAK